MRVPQTLKGMVTLNPPPKDAPGIYAHHRLPAAVNHVYGSASRAPGFRRMLPARHRGVSARRLPRRSLAYSIPTVKKQSPSAYHCLHPSPYKTWQRSDNYFKNLAIMGFALRERKVACERMFLNATASVPTRQRDKCDWGKSPNIWGAVHLQGRCAAPSAGGWGHTHLCGSTRSRRGALSPAAGLTVEVAGQGVSAGRHSSSWE